MFSSPLLWQIQYLVTTISKKNHKAHVAELNQLVMLYGEDARAVLVNCLLEDVDLHDRANAQRDAPKVALLHDELTKLLMRPNFVSMIASAFGTDSRTISQQPQSSPVVTEDFLANLANTVKLSPSQAAALAYALTKCSNAAYAQEAMKFLVAQLPHVHSFQDVHDNAMHAIASLVGTQEELSQNQQIVDAVSAAVRATHNSADDMLHYFPTIDPLTSFLPEPPASAIDSVSKMVANSSSIASILGEFGTQCSASPDTFRLAIQETGIAVTEAQVAEILALVVRPVSGSGSMADASALYSLLPGQDGEQARADAKEQWHLDIVAQVLKSDYQHLDWQLVVRRLDLPIGKLPLRDAESFQHLAQLYKIVSGRDLSIDPILDNWEHPLTQFNLLKHFAFSGRDLVAGRSAGASMLPTIEGAAVPTECWLNVRFYQTLLRLADHIPSQLVLQLLQEGIAKFPEYVTCGLAACQDAVSGVRAELLSQALPLFVGQSRLPTSNAVIHFLKSRNEDLLVLLYRIGFSKAVTKADIMSVDAMIPRADPIRRRVETEAQFGELLPWWSVLADNGMMNDFERRLRDAFRMPRNPTIAFEFVRRHLPGLRLRADEGGVLSAENAQLICELLASSRTEVPEQAVRELIQQVQKRQQMAAQNPGHAPQHGDAGQGAGQQRERRASAEIEEEANSYFQRIYTSDMSIAEVIQLLKDFKSSSNQREQEIFRCMIHNLFDEYRFFHKYPDRELQVTGRLFGTLIQHQLVSSITLGIALRYVLEALKKSPEKGGANEKMFRFGKIALEQFKSRLVEWPQYCSHLVQIPHLRELHPELYQEAYQAMTGAAPAGSGGAQAGAGTPAPGSNTPAAAAASAAIQAAATAPQVAEPAADIGRGGATAFGLPPHAAGANVPAPSHDFVAGILGSQGFAERKDDVQPVQQRTRKTIVEKLVEAHGETLNPVSPPENVRDQIHFIVNNVSKANLDQKVRELKELLSEEYYGWFAQYLVVKRITTQANLHPLYLTMLDKLDMPSLNKYILASIYHNTTKLLQSPKIISSSSERSLLRNLGSFLGQMTLGHNRPILQKDMDLKELLYWGYETGRLTAACSFVSKVLEGCKDSRIFRPPNPWLMGLLSVMREIFQIEDLRINIKFEVEVLCKNLGLKMEDIPLTSSLQRRQAPVKERNVDFSAKAVAGSTPIVGPVSPPLSGDSPEFKPSDSRVPNEPTVIPNLAAYVSISPSLELFAKQPHLKRVVPVAVDRAIREIIQPVVDRSVTIACVTTKELVLKDFAFDGNENQVRNAAHLMISNLAGSLALVTCKEPLRVSMGNHLRTLLSQATTDQNDIEQIVQVCSNDNLELGCMLIEKAATEKAVRDIDEALSNAYQARRKHREQFPGQPFADTAVLNKSPRLPRDLPEPLRPKTGGLQPQQLMVYEAFQRTRAQAPAPRVQQSPVLAAQQAPALQQAGKMLTPGAVPAAANLTMSQAIEAYQNCLARLDVALASVLRQLQGREVTLALLGSDHEILALLREIIMVTQQTQAAVRDESALTFAESVFKRLVENTQLETLQLEVLVGILEALRDACGSKKFNPDILQWLNNYASIQIADENARKLHIMVLLLLLRAKMLKPEEADMYLYKHMEQGHNMLWVDFAMTFVRQCVYEDPSVLQAFSSTINAIQKLRVPTPAAKKQIQSWVQELFKLGASREEAAKQQAAAVGASPRQTPSPAPCAVDAVGAAAAAAAAGAAGAAPAPGAGMPPTHPASLREAVTVILERWIRIWNSQNEQVYAQFLQLLHQLNVLKTEETVSKFFKTATELCVDACLKSQQRAQQQQQAQQPGAQDVAPAALNYTVIDALSRLFLLLVRLADKDPADVTGRVNLLSRILGAVGTALLEDHEAKKTNKQNFDQRPYHRLLANLLSDLGVPEPKQEPNPALLPVLSTFAQTLSALQPSVAPGFAFAWLELVSHRCFMPNVLLMKDGKGWPLMHRLLISLLAFLQPFLKTVQLTDAIRKLFKGTLRVLLVLLHDFPEFLCEYHLTFCDYIPPTCVQLRNLVLSAFPRAMRLPDPFTPNLKVDLLPEINQSPRIRTDYTAELNERGIRQRLDAFLTSRQPANFLQQLPSVLMTGPNGSYNLPLMTSLVVYVGANAIMQLQTKQALQTSAAMDVYQYLVRTLDPEGRYHLLNAIANQLRYPNNHTHYFSCVMLFLFAEAGDDTIKEQITRVLLERLIVHRPHPWGLLITFIELIKNPRYEFWRQPFTRCAPEIERVFESVARSCIGSQAAGQQQPGASAGADGAKAPSGMASVLGGPDGSL